MSKKTKANPLEASDRRLRSARIKDSAHQIWLAGLGAFSMAQVEGSKVFETLVKEGLSLQKKGRDAAGERVKATQTRLSDLAQDLSGRANNQWDKLEGLFEDRLARSLERLGVPSAQSQTQLAQRVAALEARTALVAPVQSSPRPAARKRSVATGTAQTKAAAASPRRPASAKPGPARPRPASDPASQVAG